MLTESELNSVTPKGSIIARKRLEEIIRVIGDIQKKQGKRNIAKETAAKLGIIGRFIK